MIKAIRALGPTIAVILCGEFMCLSFFGESARTAIGIFNAAFLAAAFLVFCLVETIKMMADPKLLDEVKRLRAGRDDPA